MQTPKLSERQKVHRNYLTISLKFSSMEKSLYKHTHKQDLIKMQQNEQSNKTFVDKEKKRIKRHFILFTK